VIAALPAVARVRLAEPTPAADQPSPRATLRRLAVQIGEIEKPKRQSPQTERARRYIPKNFPDGTDGITTVAIHKKLVADPDLKKELKAHGTWNVPSMTAINRALGRRKPKT
jgi:hypothetical protein